MEDLLLSYGPLGVMVAWFMIKDHKDKENIKDILTEIKLIIAGMGEFKHYDNQTHKGE